MSESESSVDPSTDRQEDVSGLGYEQARDELADVVRTLETGGLTLEESLTLWERGEQLARRCEEQLAGAKQRVEQVLRRGEHPTPAADQG